MASPVLIKNRYEVKDVLGRGGMGVVYKAFDTLMRREVAVKTLRDVASSVFVDLFYRECSVLTAMVHPNIVEIFDMGEFEEDGVLKPYFVMPLLPGRTLYDLIYPAGTPLPPQRCADIISQACRGLHAAHECGLLHRDIKPRNIFVMRDDAVKLIDFGVVRLLGSQTIGANGTLGTLHYMAPEQIQLKPLTGRSDIFSLATVCYEALTGVHPFIRNNDTETAAAVVESTPALASVLNPVVSRPLAQAVAQAMAKDPRNRFETAAAFGEALQRGLRNEKISAASLNNAQNRIARAQRSFARGDFEFTKEILDQLEAEGADEPEVRQLRIQLDEAVRKQQTEVQLTAARRYFQEEEYVLALRRVAEILETNPSNHAALSLKNEIEDRRTEVQVAEWLAVAAGHLETGSFDEARRLIQDSLRLQPNNQEAQKLLQLAEKRELEWPREREEQENLFQAAQSAYFEGRFDTSLRDLERLAELARKSKAAGARAAEYYDFYKRVRGDYDALQSMLSDARKLLANGDWEGAHALCERLREQCPQDADVRALSLDIAARRNEREQEYRRGIETRLEGEVDLNAQLHILTQAVRSRPNDEYFHRQRQKIQNLLKLVTEAVERAEGYESIGRYEYALEEWLCVGDLYPPYPGLKGQIARVQDLFESARAKAKADLAVAVTEALKRGDLQGAAQILEPAKADFQGEPEYQQLEAALAKSLDTHKQVDALLGRIQKAESEGRFTDIPLHCQNVVAQCQEIDPLRERAFGVLTSTGGRLTARNWHVAKQILQEAARIGSVPPELYQVIHREEREEEVSVTLSADRSGSVDLEAYRERIAAVLDKYPDEVRLQERLRLIDAALVEKRKRDERQACVGELALLDQELNGAQDHLRLWDTQLRAKSLAARYPQDEEIAKLLAGIVEQVSSFELAAEALSRERILECYEICDSVLARRPQHFLFQKLRGQAEARHRYLGEEYLLRVERWLASESDVYKREEILKKAQAEYPFEARYAEELQHVQREKSIAESMAAKARDFEKRGQFAEAVAHWRQLRNISPSYPDVDQHLAHCEHTIDRQQRKAKAQRLLTQGQAHLAAGNLVEGYDMIHEAWQLTDEIPDALRLAAPDLVTSARTALATNARLADSMANLAQSLDEGLKIPKDLRTRITDARRTEELADCLTKIQSCQKSGDLSGALAAADGFLAEFPGVKQIESLRIHIAAELEQERKQQMRTQTLEEFRELESRSVNMNSEALVDLTKAVREMASRNMGDEEVNQRAATLDSLFGLLSEVRGHLEAGRAIMAERACARAFEKFPDHPLFKGAMVEVSKQKAEITAKYVENVKFRLSEEQDLSKQAAILREGLVQYPNERYLLDELAQVDSKMQALNAQLDKARGLEGKQLFGEAIREWEILRKSYPWYPGVDREVDRLANARRKDKQDAQDRWFRQVEEAIDNGDYETASVMIRQAQQQKPDPKINGLDAKLREGLKKKQDSDLKFAEGKRLLADGDLAAGGTALHRAFELQPRDKQRAESIATSLLEAIRAHVDSDFAACENLVSLLTRIDPTLTLPPDLKEKFGKARQAAGAEHANARKAAEELARLARQVETARSKRSLATVSRRVQDSGLLDSRDVEIRRGAGELVRKINLRMSGFESSSKSLAKTPPKFLAKGGSRVEPTQKKASRLSVGGVLVGVLLVLCAAALAYVSTRSFEESVPVRISVVPEHATVEVSGKTCVLPDCKLSLKPGRYVFNLRKDGYKPKRIVVPVEPGDSTPLNLNAVLEPLGSPGSAASPAPSSAVPGFPAPALTLVKQEEVRASLARIEIRGALPRTRIQLDGEDIGLASDDGSFVVRVEPGPHTIVLSLEGFTKRTIKRDLARGELVSLVGEAVQLVARQPNVRR